MISRITMRYFSALDLTQIFEKTFNQLAYVKTTFLVFSRLVFQSRDSKDKNLKELELSKILKIVLIKKKSYNFLILFKN